MKVGRFVARHWLPATVPVVAGVALCVRLGIWQLDRLEQRRAFNREYLAARQMPVLDLNRLGARKTGATEWRTARGTGTYDPQHQVAIRNQYWQGEYGFRLVTPLLIDPEYAVLVDRGWIPAEGNERSEDWRRYDQEGAVTVEGLLRGSAPKPLIGGLSDEPPADAAHPLEVWNNLDLDEIAAQLPYSILPFFLQPAGDGDTAPPIPSQPEITLTEGPHMGYALQWFAFAAILLIGYPIYVRRQSGGEAK